MINCISDQMVQGGFDLVEDVPVYKGVRADDIKFDLFCKFS